MTRRPAIKKRPAKSENKEKSKAIKISPDYEQQFPTVYSNFASISRTPFEFAIDFCIIGPHPKHDENDNTVYVPIGVRVLIPNQVVPKLIEAIQEHIEKTSKMLEEAVEKP